MNWKPNRWIAVMLSLVFSPFGMLYVNRAWLAGVYIFLNLGAALAQYWLISKGLRVELVILVSVVTAFHAYSISQNAASIDSRPWFTRWYGMLSIFLIVAGVVISSRVFFFEPFRIPAQTMFPSIPKGAYVVTQKYGYGNYASYGIQFLHTEISSPLNRGDILVFEYPRDRNISYAKRLIGLPSDHIKYKGKHLYINDQPVPSTLLGAYDEFDIVHEANYRIANTHGIPSRDFDVIVKAGHLFLLGDNRDDSIDSRFFGQLPFDHVVGKVVFVLKDGKAIPLAPEGEYLTQLIR